METITKFLAQQEAERERVWETERQNWLAEIRKTARERAKQEISRIEFKSTSAKRK